MGTRAAGPGVPGSWANGIPALRNVLGTLGIPLNQVDMVDGSGLSREDRLSARALVAALHRADDTFGIAPEFEAALPIAAEDGTLHERARAAAERLRAKTGSLDGVTALAGFAHPPQGNDRIFAILVNRPTKGDHAAAEAVDGFAAALVAEPTVVRGHGGPELPGR
jgi:D-alanyl-D-alanine carboxypeptidase/D-alanyl-D-alanine-endopeptidase (penicillin-binding protein 4)